MVLGQALAAVGYFALARIDAATPYSLLVGPLLAAGIGVALTVPSMTAAVLINVEKPRTGIASGALNAARQTGGVIGVGVFGSLVAGGPDRLLGGMHLALVLAGVALAIGCLASVLGIGPRQSTDDSVTPIATQCPSA
jgi:MFS transporter, DHA2 family, methylenomycin A resistance protein